MLGRPSGQDTRDSDCEIIVGHAPQLDLVDHSRTPVQARLRQLDAKVSLQQFHHSGSKRSRRSRMSGVNIGADRVDLIEDRLII